MSDPWSAKVPLPHTVEQLLEDICRKQNQKPPAADVRLKLASLGEEAALEILRKISASVIKSTLSAFIVYMIKNESPQRLAPVSPLRTPSSPSRLMFSPPQEMRHCNTNQSHLEGDVTSSNKKNSEDMQSGFIDKSMVSVFSSSREVIDGNTPSSSVLLEDRLDLNHWLPSDICSIYRKRGILKLYPWQVECLQMCKFLLA